MSKHICSRCAEPLVKKPEDGLCPFCIGELEAGLGKPIPRFCTMQRWLRRIERDKSGCWIWQGALNLGGYGHAGYGANGKHCDVLVHRFFYLYLKGEIPLGLELDHLCRVPNCVNPEHLEPVTRAENQRRGMAGGLRNNGPSAINAAKTHCIHGHPFNKENTYYIRGGGRSCKECGRTRKRLEMRRKRAEQRKGVIA